MNKFSVYKYVAVPDTVSDPVTVKSPVNDKTEPLNVRFC